MYAHYLKLLNEDLEIDYEEVETIIETGSHRGNGAATFALVFKKVYSIELSDSLYEHCLKTHRVDNIEFIHGASTDVLPSLMPKITGDYMVFLDAHGSGGDTTFDPRVGRHGAPVIEELEAMKPNPPKIIVVDDLRCFDDKQLQYPSRQQIIDKVAELADYSEPKVIYYNGKPQWFCFERITSK
jgi:hypothetical protein